MSTSKLTTPMRLALLFPRRYDEPGVKPAEPIDVSEVYGACHDELAGVNRESASSRSTAMPEYQRVVEKVPRTPMGDDVYALFNNKGKAYPIGASVSLFVDDLSGRIEGNPDIPAIVAAIVGAYMTEIEGRRTAPLARCYRSAETVDDDEPNAECAVRLVAGRPEHREDRPRPDPEQFLPSSSSASGCIRNGRPITAIKDDIKKNFYPIPRMVRAVPYDVHEGKPTRTGLFLSRFDDVLVERCRHPRSSNVTWIEPPAAHP